MCKYLHSASSRPCRGHLVGMAKRQGLEERTLIIVILLNITQKRQYQQQNNNNKTQQHLAFSSRKMFSLNLRAFYLFFSFKKIVRRSSHIKANRESLLPHLLLAMKAIHARQ